MTFPIEITQDKFLNPPKMDKKFRGTVPLKDTAFISADPVNVCIHDMTDWEALE